MNTQTNDSVGIDARLKQLSYSSRLLLSSCPRKYELRKLNVADNYFDDADSLITKAFGHSVGFGIQLVFQNKTKQEIYWEMFLAWELELLQVSSRHKKSFSLALIAVDKLLAMRESGFLADYELMYYDGKPAVEMSFLIDFNDGFKERGFVDLVIENKETGQVIIVEVKTDSSRSPIHEAKYANSSQALGYSIVLDHIKPGLASYEVYYLVYKSEALEYQILPFTKSLLHKAEWLTSVMIDIEKVKLYSKMNLFPKHGQSCLAWNRPCEFFGICTLTNQMLVTTVPSEQIQKEIEESNKDYQIRLNVNDLIASQLAKEI